MKRSKRRTEVNSPSTRRASGAMMYSLIASALSDYDGNDLSSSATAMRAVPIAVTSPTYRRVPHFARAFLRTESRSHQCIALLVTDPLYILSPRCANSSG